jgi:hypothetical protein
MFAHVSHIPSCDPVPTRERRRLRAYLPLLAAALLIPAHAQAQEVRARDLSIIEDLLAETVQEAIEVTVRSVNTENLRAQEEDPPADEAVRIRYVFRSGGRTQARGMFLEDYGVVFTVQVPHLTYTNSAVFALPRSGEVAAVDPDSFDAVIGGALGQEMQLRNQISRNRVETDVMIQRLEREVAAADPTSEHAQNLRAALAEMERAYSEFAAQAENATSERERQRAAEEERGTDARGSAPGRLAGLRMLANASPEDIARAEALATNQKNQIEGAVITAVVDTMAQYGRVVHGLEDDDRLAVVILPSSYLNQMVSWLRATQRDEELVISVRYRDILELDNGDIDPEEFGGRIRVESRLGQPRQRD